MENNGAVLIATAAGGFDVRTFQENEEQQSIYEDNKDMLQVMQPRMSALVFQMITSILEYSQSINAPGVVKSLSNPTRIDQAYLNKVIEASRGEIKKEEPKKIGIAVKIRGKGGDKSASGEQKNSPAKQEQAAINEKLQALAIDGYSDDEDDGPQGNIASSVDFYRKQSETLKAAADKIERGFSLNKAVQDEKIPELMKRKTSMQANLEFEMGGIQKIREAKEKEWDRPQETIKGKTDDGEFFEITSPALPKDANQ